MSEQIKKKKFKDTKLGAWLKEKAPVVLNQVGDLLPDSGTLGIVKRGIDILSPEDKEQGLKEVEKVERKLTQIDIENAKIELEEQKLMLQNLEGAREMNMKDDEVQKKFSMSFLFSFMGVIVVVISMVCYASYFKIKVESQYIVLITSILTMIGSKLNTIIDFYFGGSEGQKNTEKGSFLRDSFEYIRDKK